MNLILAITIFFSGGISSTFQACYRESGQPQVCEAPNATAGSSDGFRVYLSHTFKGLKGGKIYQFTYKENGIESYPMSYETQIDTECPDVAPVECPVVDPTLTYHPNGQSYKDHWDACRANVCELWSVYVGSRRPDCE